ncbi:hypothetical protein SIN01_21490 [Sporolactobacillus inulinus]|nr:hypothetical protein SIN01_21490 [Sporolactobacillus inulinus]
MRAVCVWCAIGEDVRGVSGSVDFNFQADLINFTMKSSPV